MLAIAGDAEPDGRDQIANGSYMSSSHGRSKALAEGAVRQAARKPHPQALKTLGSQGLGVMGQATSFKAHPGLTTGLAR